jgi:hypothetical protein
MAEEEPAAAPADDAAPVAPASAAAPAKAAVGEKAKADKGENGGDDGVS